MTQVGALNIKEAIALYLESLAAHDEPVPPLSSEEIIDDVNLFPLNQEFSGQI